jgi:hypothetical protein
MRRSQREITDRAEIDAIIRRSQVCRLGLTDGDEPYVVPLCFGYDGEALYFHCAKEGRKLDILRKNNRVCFEFDIVEGIIKNTQACGWGMRYRSVIGVGTAHLVEKNDEKIKGLALIMNQYADGRFIFPDDAVVRTSVIKVLIESVSGKQRKQT